MKNQYQVASTMDEQGRLVIPPEIAQQLGLTPGAQVHLEKGDNSVTILRALTQLALVYIEPTNGCNLDCRTCMRNVWSEHTGHMSKTTFERILTGLSAASPRPRVFFGGIGEPLSHPDIIEMIHKVKALGCQAELITNGTLLDENMIVALMRSGLDTLWVSLDGATPESYADVRLGANLPGVIENLQQFKYLRYQVNRFDEVFELGIAFVAMERNINDLPEVIRLGVRLGARRFSISNVLAHTPEMKSDILYENSRRRNASRSATALSVINLPRMDIDDRTSEALLQVLGGNYQLQVSGKEVERGIDTCQFVEKGSMAVRWDGNVSPCVQLMHDNEYYIDGRHHRQSHAHIIGNVNERHLLDLWNDPEYLLFRKRLREFSFSPCTYCTGCDLSTENKEDCRANPFPTCGGCLWSQGFIQCP
jgi:MoaA/NifB/PqqE/SkfB family radical SAM enzyme